MSAPHFKYIDDPFLIPTSNLDKVSVEAVDGYLCLLSFISCIFIRVTRQNGIGQNGTDKMVAIFIEFNSIEFIFSNHKSQTSDKPKWV